MDVPVVSLFPDEPLFRTILSNSRTNSSVIFQDPTCGGPDGIHATYARLLRDVTSLRRQLYQWLPESMFDGRGRVTKERPYILIQAPANYEFVVASLAVLAIGAALVPIAPAILPEEAAHFAQQCSSALLLASSTCWDCAVRVRDHLASHQDEALVTQVHSIASGLSECNDAQEYEIDKLLTIDASSPSLILFTSGTTGPPKGVVHSRLFFYFGYGSASDDVFLTHRPVHWIGGLRSTINLVVSGTRQEVVACNEVAIWERLRKGGVTMLCCVIPMWWRLMKHFKDHLSHLPQHELNAYLLGARGLRVARIGGAAPLMSLLKFWRDIVRLPLETTYGCTETGGPGFMTDAATDRSLDRCIGKPEPGAQVRFSDGDCGEIYIKTNFLFTGYLGDQKATREAFTSDGYFKTGDLASRVGNDWVLEGRATSDFVRFHGFKVPILQVEQALMDLPSIAEACIVAVPDKDASTRVAAAVRFQDGCRALSLAQIRTSVSDKLLHYMLPTALRVLRPHDEIPLTIAGKVVRRKVATEFFPVDDGYQLPSSVEVWDINQKGGGHGEKARAWDWAGLQGCAV
ncbi:hypothetical protein CDD82_633 [Ophiocordyceps australis]|uniref:AMP-dependent synthetase/ligase domain-containing protein n=1 Tax=Ophiocordyceps australis TaxID=1399860 RepID=A0A2C5YL39_9HYPO|nr:hypothetical protein CDD82_633 [Ophiocordyceps australis]